MKTKRLLNSFLRVKAFTAFTLFVLFASAMTNSLSAQTYTHIWKGGSGDWATLSNWYDGTGSAQAAALPVAGSVVKIITGTCTINSGTTALGHVFIGNTDASTQGKLVIASGGTLTSSAAGNSLTNGALVINGGILENNGTLNVTQTALTTGYCIRLENPSTAPTGAWGMFGDGSTTGKGAVNLTLSGATVTSGGLVLFNNSNTGSNAPLVELNNPTLSIPSNATGITAINVTAACNGKIGGSGVTLGSVATGVAAGILLQNGGGSNLTINSGTTLTLYSLTGNTAKALYLFFSTGGGSFTNNGTINVSGPIAGGINLTNSKSTGTNDLSFTNNGTINMNVAISATFAGVLNLPTQAANGTNTNTITNAGRMTLVNTSAVASTGYCLYTGNTSYTSGSLLSTITNSGTFELNGTLTSTGGAAGRLTINNNNNGTFILNPPTTGACLDKTVFNNNSGGILDCKTASISSGSGYVVSIKAGSTLKTAHQFGLTCLSGSGAVTEAGANYEFNGAVAQTTGALLTAANNINITNTLGVTLAASATISGTLTVPTSGTLATGAFALTNNGTANINGTFRIDQSGSAAGSGTWNYGSGGTLTFNNTTGSFSVSGTPVFWPTTNGPVNVTVTGAGGITMGIARTVSGYISASAPIVGAGNFTINGTLQLNSGGSVDAAPTYGSSSLLKYNTGTTYDRYKELDTTTPANIQLSNNTTLNYPNGASVARTLTGNLTVDAGSSLYMDYNSIGMNQPLSVNGNVTLNGNLSLGDAIGGDLNVGGNWTRAASGSTFTDHSRAVTFNGTGSQTISNTGGETFAYLTVTKPSGILTLNNNTTVNNNLVINSTSAVTLSFGKTLAVTGNFTINSTSSGTGTFVNNGTTTVTGTTSVNQYLASARNWYISSPVNGATTPSGYTVYRYREPGDNSSYTNPATAYWESLSQGTTFENGRGYIALPSSGPVTLTFAGAINNGNITTGSLTRTTNASKLGFNLVGNPYPAFLNLATMDTTKVLGSFWLRSRNSGDTAYDFDTYNITSGLGISKSSKSVTSYIPPMQAFWVRVKQGQSSATLTFSNAMCGHSNTSNNIFRAPSNSNVNQQALYLQLSNGVNMDETILAFNPNASNGTDAYDTPKMGINSASIPEIYTVVANEQLAINGMNSIPYDTEIPLGFTTGTAGTFSIIASQLVNFDSSVNIYLKDYNDLVNTPVLLTSDAVYNFSSNVTTNNTSRFALLFKSPSVTTEINPTEKNNIWISARNRQIVLETNFTGETSVSVYNAVGLKICSNNYSKSNVQLGTSFAPGVYMVTVNNSGKTITKKVIID